MRTERGNDGEYFDKKKERDAECFNNNHILNKTRSVAV